MHVLAGLGGAALILAMLVEFFVAFMLPRRVKRDPRIARGIYTALWWPWRMAAARLSPAAEDTMLGFFGPLALLLQLVVWVLGLMVGFALLQWAFGSKLGAGPHSFGDDLYFSSGAFLSAAVSGAPIGAAAKVLSLLEAATGVGDILIGGYRRGAGPLAAMRLARDHDETGEPIGYRLLTGLTLLSTDQQAAYAAFSRREVAVSQLATRAGTPPTAVHLLRRIAEGDRWNQLRDYLGEAEAWVAELMETHLSYPLLAYYRSQHVNQNWLAALTTIVDTSAAVVAALPEGDPAIAEQTYGIGRHALSDLAHVFHVRPGDANRLTDEAFDSVWNALVAHERVETDPETMRRRLDHLRADYEPNAIGLSIALALPLPAWAPGEHDRRAPRPLRRRYGVTA